MDINALVAQILDICTKIVTFGFIVMMAITVLRFYGFNVPFAKPPGALEFAYLAGSWYALKKA